MSWDWKTSASKIRFQRELETPLSKRLLKGDIKSGQTVMGDFNAEDGLTFSVEEPVEVEEVQPVGVACG